MRRDPNDTEPLQTPSAKEDPSKGALPSATDVRGFKMSPGGTALGLGRAPVAPPDSAREAPKSNTLDVPIDEVLRGFDAQSGDVPKIVTASSEGHRAAAYHGAHAVRSGQDSSRPERPVIVDVPTDQIARPRDIESTDAPLVIPRTRGRLIVAGVVCVAVVILLVAIGRWATTPRGSEDTNSAARGSATNVASVAPPTPPPPSVLAPTMHPPVVMPSAVASVTPPPSSTTAPTAPPTATTPDPQPRPPRPAPPTASATAKPADIDVLRENMKP